MIGLARTTTPPWGGGGQPAGAPWGPLLRAPTGHAKEVLGTEELVAIADRGYSGDEIVGCEEAGIMPVVSKPMTSCQGGRWSFDQSLLELGLPALPDQGEVHAQRISACKPLRA